MWILASPEPAQVRHAHSSNPFLDELDARGESTQTGGEERSIWPSRQCWLTKQQRRGRTQKSRRRCWASPLRTCPSEHQFRRQTPTRPRWHPMTRSDFIHGVLHAYDNCLVTGALLKAHELTLHDLGHESHRAAMTSRPVRFAARVGEGAPVHHSIEGGDVGRRRVTLAQDLIMKLSRTTNTKTREHRWENKPTQIAALHVGNTESVPHLGENVYI
jgi:hypothetical protein